MNFLKRIDNVQKKLETWDVDALYCVNQLDILYLTGFDVSRGVLIITKKDSALFVDGRYFEACKLKSKIPVYLYKQQKLIDLLKDAALSHVKTIGFDAHDLTFSSYKSLTEDAKYTFVSLEMPIKWVRSVKDDDEIEKIKAACRLCDLGFKYLSSLVKEGVTEKFLAKELEIFWLKNKSDGLSFPPIIAFGKNSAYPHYRSQDVELLPNQSILVDIGVVLDRYNSDLTRIIYFGTPTLKILEIYDLVMRMQEKALSLLKDGITTQDLDLAMREILSKSGFGAEMVHGLGHGVGIEIHELPTIRKDSKIILKEGMVITIEPGVYVPEVGGVRIEDVVLIKKDGFEFLTEHASHPLIIQL